jgi:hypothetical protein
VLPLKDFLRHPRRISENSQGRGFWKKVFSNWRNGSVFFRRIPGQEDLVQYLQRMLGLADLPVCNAPAFPQVSQKGFNILSGSVFQRFFSQEIGTVFYPVHHEKIADQLHSAIELDPLCCLAWFNLAGIVGQHGNPSEAMAGFLVCSVTCDWDRESWINAMFLAFNERNDVMFLRIANAVYRKFGRSILNEIGRFVKKQPDAMREKKKGLYEGIVAIFNQIEERGGVLTDNNSP